VNAPVEHPFAQYVRILGKGKRGARGLTREEAREAMGMLLDGSVEDVQLGAFLMLLRHKEESAEELAGFVEAVRARLQVPTLRLDIDWPSYAGKKRHLPWYLLAAKALANGGLRILMHGGDAHTAGRLYSEQLLESLDIPRCSDWQGVSRALDAGQLAFLPLANWMPPLQRMIEMRNLLGLRSPVHSLLRLVNPGAADCGLQSIFHPGYAPIHREASRMLGDRAIVIKGEGGEIEVNPDVDCQLFACADGEAHDERWPALSEQRQVKPERLDPAHLLAVWRGESEDNYGLQACVASMALALHGLGRPREEAFNEAQRLWKNRHESI